MTYAQLGEVISRMNETERQQTVTIHLHEYRDSGEVYPVSRVTVVKQDPADNADISDILDIGHVVLDVIV